MARLFLLCASAIFLISAPATADQHRVLLNCGVRAGAEHGTVFIIDFGQRTVSVRIVDRGGFIEQSGREQLPANFTREVISFGFDNGLNVYSYRINRVGLTVRVDCSGPRCGVPTTFHGPCAVENARPEL